MFADVRVGKEKETMGKDATELVVGAGGRVWFADLDDATAPTDSTTALVGNWKDGGFVGEEGVTFHDTVEKKRVPAWNARRPIASIPGDASTTLAWSFLQWNADTIAFALGGEVSGASGAVAEVVAIALTDFSGTDSFHLTYGGQESAVITRGTNFTADGIKTAIEETSGVSFTVDVTDVTDAGFLITFEPGARTAVTVTNTSGVTATVQVLVEGSDSSGTDSVFTPDPDGDHSKMLVVEWVYNGKHYRLFCGKGETQGDVEVALTQKDESPLPVSFECYPDEDDDPYLLFTDDPAFAS